MSTAGINKFRFPTNGKAHVNLTLMGKLQLSNLLSFDSLPTGKHTGINWTTYALWLGGGKFRFPKNGKELGN